MHSSANQKGDKIEGPIKDTYEETKKECNVSIRLAKR
jgi:hypothetical protein